jgi:hypothetical protein
MNYIYDIVLNFQNNYYNFFEWSRKDKLKNISKISLYHITDKDMLILKNNKVTINNSFLEQIKNDNKKHKHIICLVSNGKLAIGLQFDNNGNLKKRSSLIFEEEEEVINAIKYLPITKIDYVQNIPIKYQNKLRIEKEKKDTLINYITNNSDILTLKYLYYEYYEKETNNISLIKKSLLKELSKEWNSKQNNLYTIVNMLQKVK